MSLIRYKLVFFSPTTDTQRILSHLFQKFPAELGKIGDYEHCAFISKGTGQFKPGSGANPSIGAIGVLQQVDEDRVEIMVKDTGNRQVVKDAIVELKSVHPYEEVAYDVYKLEDF